jgi:ubiquinone/menaquinone biosynthesis C-methylase UbiE
MGTWYEQRIFNPLMDWALSATAVAALRAELLRDGPDELLEVGPGTGLNVPHYPSQVRRVRALAREERLDARLLERAARRGLAVELVRGDAARIPLPDASVDAVVCTFVLCSVDSPRECLAEFARVLRPGGRLHLLEHVRSPRRLELGLQRALTPLQRIVACGCELDRDLLADIAPAGFDVRTLRSARSAALPFPASELLSGVALRR